MIFTGLNFGQILHILNNELKKNCFLKCQIGEMIVANEAEFLIKHVLMKALLHFCDFYT